MFWTKRFVGFVVLCLVVSAYLFATAPAALPEAGASTGERGMSVNDLFEIVAKENARARSLYTSRIVGPGKKVGLAFAEDWLEAEVDAGPLPALFLRETARNLERRPEPLGLFLGSDAPISEANLFRGSQAEQFAALRADGTPRHFFTPDLGVYSAMFPDMAVAPACVECHNEHPNTPKRDWKLNDVMGATTWTYPKAEVSLTEALGVVDAFRGSVRDAYTAYVDKAKTFATVPEIGELWPSNGYCIPSPDAFMGELEQSASRETLSRLLLAP